MVGNSNVKRKAGRLCSCHCLGGGGGGGAKRNFQRGFIQAFLGVVLIVHKKTQDGRLLEISQAKPGNPPLHHKQSF